MRKIGSVLFLLVCLTTLSFSTAMGADGIKQENKEYIKWSSLSVKESKDLKDVAYGGGHFAAVGGWGVIQVSEDGVKWREIDWNGSAALHKLIYNGTCFVAVGDGIILKSADGLTWEKVLVLQGPAAEERRFDNLIWTGKGFFAFGPGKLYRSQDGTLWEPEGGPDLPQGSRQFEGVTVNSVAASGDRIVATAIERGYRIFMVTEDGGTWSKMNAPNIGYSYDCPVYYTGQYFVVPGTRGFAYSEDGKSWSIRNGEHRFVASWTGKHGSRLYSSDTIALFVSEDGFQWQETRLGNSKIPVRAVAWDGDEKLVAVGDSGLVFLSEGDGQWAKVDTGVFYATNAAATDEKVLVAVGDYGQILISTDGDRWERLEAGTDKSLQCVLYAGERFVAAGEDGEILISGDGRQWRRVESGIRSAVRTLAYGAGRYVAAGDEGLLAVSADGEKWERIDVDLLDVRDGYQVDYSRSPIHGLVYNGEYFLAVSTAFTFRSPDGLQWERLRSNTVDVPDRVINGFDTFGPGNTLAWDGKKVWLSAGGVTAQTDDGQAWRYVGDLWTQGRQLNYVDGLYFSGANISVDGVSWVQAGTGSGDPIRFVAGFKGKLYAYGDRGRIVKGTLQSRPEPSDIRYIRTNTTSGFPKELEGIKPVLQDGLLFLPLDIINGFIEGKLTLDGKGGFTLSKNDFSMAFKAGSGTVHIKGQAAALPAESRLSGKRLLVPAAFVFHQFGFEMTYDPLSNLMKLSYRSDGEAVEVEWKACRLPGADNRVGSMAWNGEVYGLCAQNISGSYIAVSVDGMNWTKAADLGKNVYAGIFTLGKRFFMMGTKTLEWDSTGRAVRRPVLYSSDDGAAWQRQETGELPPFAHHAASNGHIALIMGEDNWVYRTTDGLNWEKGALLKSTYYVRWTGDGFIAFGNYDIYHSADGVEWSAEAVPGPYADRYGIIIRSADELGGRLFAERATEVYMRQGDAGWEKVFSLPHTSPFIAGKTQKHMIVAMTKESYGQGEKGIFLYRTADGKVWESVTAPSLGNIESFYDDGKRVFLGGYGGLVVGDID